MRLTALFGPALLAYLSPALAQESVATDLDGDGRAEVFSLRDTGDGAVDLLIDGAPLAPGIAWTGGPGQVPELTLAPNGSVRLTSMNEAVGRDRWHLTLTLAYRDGAYRIAGLTWDWYDTLDPARAGGCDLNLLTGRGFVTRGAGKPEPARTALRAPRVETWTQDTPLPEICPQD